MTDRPTRSRVAPGRWVITGTRIDERYPCRCGHLCGQRCPCRGRLDGAVMSTGCCARRIHDTAARAAGKEQG